jgi:hypothetical protein
MWTKIQADPIPWTTYLNRVLYYMVSSTYLPSGLVPPKDQGGVQVDTLSPATYTATGKAAGYQPIVVEQVGFHKGLPKLVIYAAEYVDQNATTSGAAPASASVAARASRRRKARKAHKVNIVMADLVDMSDIGAWGRFFQGVGGACVGF